MKKSELILLKAVLTIVFIALYAATPMLIQASSHREAPLIANDPQADNTDLYVFRSPDDTNTVTIIATYIPFELPQAGPNYYSFGEKIRYDIHIKNNTSTTGDNITYRFTFTQTNEDTATFFNIRFGKQNLKTTYLCQRSLNGAGFTTVVSGGIVPPNNIGPRSISDPVLGLNSSYAALMQGAIKTGCHGEKIFCGPVDDPFFVDMGGLFDLAQTRAGGTGVDAPKDGMHCKNVHAIAMKIPISQLQKAGKNVSQAVNILDPDFVIGVWASASRQRTTTLSLTGGKPATGGTWVQVSRIGMPLTNEVFMPINKKDLWNTLTPYNESTTFSKYFITPELGLYMDPSQFGGSFPALTALHMQANSLGAYGFRNNQSGLYSLKGSSATVGTALDDAIYGTILLPGAGQPRSVDLYPMFNLGIPNLRPYQLAINKNNNPLAAGKPFINNFLPVPGDMLRLNMAVPVTPRNSPDFSSEGLIAAAIKGLTDPAFANNTLEWIPNMDGFPNGRRLEDDVTRITLQCVSGIMLAVIGLPYDDAIPGVIITPAFNNVANYTTGIENNDKAFSSTFPFVAEPWSGYGLCEGGSFYRNGNAGNLGSNLSTPDVIMMQNYPNPATDNTTFKYRITSKSKVTISICDQEGRIIESPVNEKKSEGTYELIYNVARLNSGIYFATIRSNGEFMQAIKFVVEK
ncbi:MAG: DUF4331 family protein [Bacteroidota bacterium]